MLPSGSVRPFIAPLALPLDGTPAAFVLCASGDDEIGIGGASNAVPHVGQLAASLLAPDDDDDDCDDDAAAAAGRGPCTALNARFNHAIVCV